MTRLLAATVTALMLTTGLAAAQSVSKAEPTGRAAPAEGISDRSSTAAPGAPSAISGTAAPKPAVGITAPVGSNGPANTPGENQPRAPEGVANQAATPAATGITGGAAKPVEGIASSGTAGEKK